jgi:hypothetical protein
MKFNIEVKATVNEKDPAYKTITQLGIQKTIERFSKELSSIGAENVQVSITENKEG